ncbi:MAG: hypothetical protein ACPGR5_07445, partial [Chitinophagales bacterium]
MYKPALRIDFTTKKLSDIILTIVSKKQNDLYFKSKQIMKIIFVFFVVLSNTYSKAQSVSSYKLPNEIKNELDVNGMQTSAMYYSQIGLDSLAIYSYSEGRIVDDNNISFNFCPYRVIPFYDYIEKIADDYDLIIINEAHHKSYDRQVINKLIKVLHNKNYKNYGM